MADASTLPPGFTVDQNDSATPTGSTALPAGFEVEPDTSGAGPDPVQAAPLAVTMPTTAQLTDQKNSNADVGELARQTGAAIAAGQAQGPLSDVGDWFDAKLRSIVAAPVNAVADLFGAKAPITVTPTAGAQRVSKTIADVTGETAEQNMTPAQKAAAAAVQPVPGIPQSTLNSYENSQAAQTAARKVSDVETIGGVVAPFLGPAEEAAAAVPSPTTVLPKPTAEEVLARQAATQNASAAAAVPSLDGASQGTRDAVANASGVHMGALNRQLNADQLVMPDGQTPTPLMEGQAQRDSKLIADTWNVRDDPATGGDIRASIDGQNQTQALSLGEIRRQATPDVVSRTPIENSQAAIDAIKTQDNANILDTRAKYQTLFDADDGGTPFDTKSALAGAQTALSDQHLGDLAANHDVLSSVMKSMGGAPMNSEQFENARTALARVQREGGSPATAAGILRNSLENAPLTPEAANLKSLADTARAAARYKFQLEDQNPAYSAVVNDNVPRDANGLHVIGAKSPLAPSFMDDYFLGNSKNAAPAYVDRLNAVMGDNPDFKSAVQASTLLKLRDAANLDSFDDLKSGGFNGNAFRKQLNSLSNKSTSLMSPSTISGLGTLGQYSEDVGWEGASSSKNRSNTAQTMDRLKEFGAQDQPAPTPPSPLGSFKQGTKDLLTDAVVSHVASPAVAGAGRIGRNFFRAKKLEAANQAAQVAKEAAAQSVQDAKLKFAQHVTAPGAGIDLGRPVTTGAVPVTPRATGGRVDHEALADQLFKRWKLAQKHADKTTEPLLGLPDETIAKALKISQRHASI